MYWISLIVVWLMPLYHLPRDKLYIGETANQYMCLSLIFISNVKINLNIIMQI